MNSPVQVVEAAGGASEFVDTLVGLEPERLLRAVSTDGSFVTISDWAQLQIKNDVLNPATAAPKWPRTGARALLISRLTDS